MQVGDIVKMSDKNPNHLGNDVDAYAGMVGIVTDVWEDGAFALDCKTSILVVPMNDAFKNPKKGLWIWLNGKHIFYKRKKEKKQNWLQKLIYNFN